MKNPTYSWLVYLILTVVFFSISSDCYASIKIIPEPETPPAVVAQVQKVVDHFNGILQDDMNVTLKRDVRLYTCPTIANYQTVLKRELGETEKQAQRTAAITGGVSSGYYQAVAFNCTPPAVSNSFGFTKTVGHELFHQVQAELSNNQMHQRGALPWMIEGTADLIGARVAEKLGYQSMDKWKLDRLNYLRTHPDHAAVAEVIYTTSDKWETLIEQRQSSYEISDLMVFYLLTQKNGYEGIAQYFRLLGDNMDSDTAFEKSFHITSLEFSDKFQEWFDTALVQSSQGEIIVQEGVTDKQAADFKQAFDLTNDFFDKEWHAEIATSQRIILTSNKSQFAAAISKEFGITLEQATERAKNIQSTFSQSTAIFDLSKIHSSPASIYLMASYMVQRYQNEASLPQVLINLSWLRNGSYRMTGAHIVELANFTPIEKYKATIVTNLRKAPAIPDLDELTTPTGWKSAMEKYGVDTTYRVSELAAAYLADKYGLATFNAWYLAAKDTKDAKAAFTKVYGIPLAQFNTEFKNYLTEQLQAN